MEEIVLVSNFRHYNIDKFKKKLSYKNNEPS